MRIPTYNWPNRSRYRKVVMIDALLRATCWFLCLWLALAATGCRGAFRQPTPSAEPMAGVPKQLLNRQVIVTLAPASAEQWAHMATDLAQTYGLPKVGAFPLTSIGVQCIVFQLPADRSMRKVLTALAADPRVESVQPNRFFTSQSVGYNDPYARLQYGVKAVRADLVHHVVTGKGVTIAVIDTGVDTDHPDLRDSVLKTANFVEGGEQTFTQDYHGTAMVGVMAARANNAIGILGIAPEADILALKACWQRTAVSHQALCSSWTLAKAVDFAILNGARIVNFSLAGPSDPLLARLLAKAVAHGIVLVAATLEPDQGLGFPASLDTVMAVLAGDSHGQVRLPVATQPASLLIAPGIDILTTVPHRTYDFVSGSSLAAAHVSGIAALLIEQQPTLSPARLYMLLQTTARPVAVVSGASTATVGFVDTCAALRKISQNLFCSKLAREQ